MAEVDKDDLIRLIDETDKQEPIPDILPMMPLRDVVIFTDMLLPLFVGRDKSVRAIEEAAFKSNYLLLVTQKNAAIDDPKPEDMFEVGTVARVLRLLKLPDGRIKALVQGVCRAKVLEYLRKKASYRVKVALLKEQPVTNITIETIALMRSIREHSQKILSLRGEMTNEIAAILDNIEEPGKLADLIASNMKIKIEESQLLLELTDPIERLQKVNELLAREVALSAVQAKIQSNVRDEISKSQRDYFLREQVRAIYKELGDGEDRMQETEEYQKKIKRAKMPKEVRAEALKQLKRLEQMHPDTGESSIVRTYLDWLVEMPWSKSTKDKIDIKKAQEILNKQHYGLEKVKDRILEYLSVRKLNPNMKGPILCFVGPPGVGKTSLGKAIASAVKRKFVRISLGGIRDEAEIRGHRRTYIGALPGRILQGLKQAGVNNPVFMMDEIDKLCSDFRGDPSSALLEVLDPEQNVNFSDHYLNVPFDLSGVLFILTANMTDTLPSPLMDRMEIISISGYTDEEKLKIAQNYLLPRQLKENGLKPKNLSISSATILYIIREYTSEAGVRNLERELGTLCRKVARKIAEGTKDIKDTFYINRNNLKKFLGVPKFQPEMDKEDSQIGLATGLAWTQVGGEVLYIEASLIPGKGELIITGQIGEVMQESARAAVTYARANLSRYEIEDNFFDDVDIHIHVPAGAIPKDGPSAGIAMATALISLITGRPINKDIAMTGEITLRGRVLPIGGLKEKTLGAIRGRIHTIIIPEKNLKDLDEIPDHVKRKVKFVPVRHIDEVLPLVLEEVKEPIAHRIKKPSKAQPSKDGEPTESNATPSA